MRRLHPVLLAAFALAGAAPAEGSARFSRAIEDLPLMSGLEETEESFRFETARGRIAGAVAQGEVDAGAVAAFYLQTLPELGWRRGPDHGLVFWRGAERLDITVAPQDEGARVTFSLRPDAGQTGR